MMLMYDFEVPTAFVIKISIFWNITPFSPLKIDRRFGGTCRFQLQGLRISKASNNRDVGRKQALLAGFLLGLLFGTEVGSDRLLRNFG
jgi:hypothetical protein